MSITGKKILYDFLVRKAGKPLKTGLWPKQRYQNNITLTNTHFNAFLGKFFQL